MSWKKGSNGDVSRRPWNKQDSALKGGVNKRYERVLQIHVSMDTSLYQLNSVGWTDINNGTSKSSVISKIALLNEVLNAAAEIKGMYAAPDVYFVCIPHKESWDVEMSDHPENPLLMSTSRIFAYYVFVCFTTNAQAKEWVDKFIDAIENDDSDEEDEDDKKSKKKGGKSEFVFKEKIADERLIRKFSLKAPDAYIRSIILHHGGSIRFDSRECRGSDESASCPINALSAEHFLGNLEWCDFINRRISNDLQFGVEGGGIRYANNYLYIPEKMVR